MMIMFCIYAISIRFINIFLQQDISSHHIEKKERQGNDTSQKMLNQIDGITSDKQQLAHIISDAHTRLQYNFIKLIDKVTNKNEEDSNNISEILVSLQFEDLVMQITDRMEQKITSLRQLINLSPEDNDITTPNEIYKIPAKNRGIDNQNEKSTTHPVPVSANQSSSVAQKCLSKGTAELFR